MLFAELIFICANEYLFCVISFLGNIDQGQYCEKIKNIVEFLGMRLSNDELTTIWKMQVCNIVLSAANLLSFKSDG